MILIFFKSERVSTAQRAEELLGAVCQQLWATMESDGNPEKAQSRHHSTAWQSHFNGKNLNEISVACIRLQHLATSCGHEPFNIIFLRPNFRTRFEMMLSLTFLSLPDSRPTMTEQGSAYNYRYLHLLPVFASWLGNLQFLEKKETTHISNLDVACFSPSRWRLLVQPEPNDCCNCLTTGTLALAWLDTVAFVPGGKELRHCRCADWGWRGRMIVVLSSICQASNV